MTGRGLCRIHTAITALGIPEGNVLEDVGCVCEGSAAVRKALVVDNLALGQFVLSN